MHERSDPSAGGPPPRQPHVHALKAAYRGGRLVVSADPGILALARHADGLAIDAREVADSMLRELLDERRRAAEGGPGPR